MACFDPRRAGAISHGGTFNGNPMTMAAGLATLEELTPEAYERLEGMGHDLKGKLDALFGELGAAVQVNQVGSIFNIHFADAPVTDYAATSRSDQDRAARLHLAALNHGMALAGRCMGCLSTPMTGAEIDAFVKAIRLAMHDLSNEIRD
jgi:glutamate-1-semialdehyde 2,1-aminomutase